MDEIHICDIKDGVLHIPSEANTPDGEYVLTPGMRCNFSIMSHAAFESAVQALERSADGHKRLLRNIFSHAITVEITDQKTIVPCSFIDNADIKDCATVEFVK